MITATVMRKVIAKLVANAGPEGAAIAKALSPTPAAITSPAPVEHLRLANRTEALVMTREAIAGHVAEIRKANPRLSEHQARSRVYAEHPGLRKELVELDGREYGRRGPSQDFAKAERVSSAQIEAVAKAAELRQENPRLSEHQALDRVYKARPDLLSRLLAEQRGEG